MSSARSDDRDADLIAGAAAQFAAVRRPNDRPSGVTRALDARESSDAARVAGLNADSLTGYELLRERHRGGQGVVYEALQRATKRKVAIKVLYDSPLTGGTGRRRFEREIEILSQLRHPHIVTVHDSGEAAGRFYYVMDLVQGVPLDRWVESLRTNPAQPASSGQRAGMRAFVDETLSLFAKVADAVNAAHLRGVIHRDLKPGNILIDGAGEPRVLDFGLAKVADELPDGDPDALTAMTQPGQFVGSLPWSSPEQAAGESDQVDTRTDVYALGVLLYHALASEFPYRVVGRAADVVDQIRHVEPRSLREAIRTAGGDAPHRELRAALDGEIETIVAKCLQKDRERRYQTAGDLARDLRRYLAREPIEAKRDSLGYVLRKRLRRHRLSVAAAGAVLLAIVGGLAASLFFWRQAERQRDAAVDAAREAGARRAEAEGIADLLRSMLGSADPVKGAGRDYTVRELLDEFDRRRSPELGTQPLVDAALRVTVGNAYRQLGEFEKAAPHLLTALELLRTAAGQDDPRTAEALLSLGQLHKDQENFERAEDYFNQAQAILQRAKTPDAEALVMLQIALSELYHRTGRRDQARGLIEQTRALAAERLGENHALIGSCLHNLGQIADEERDFAAAERHYRAAIQVYEHALGPHHPNVGVNRGDLALALMNGGRLDEAEAEILRAREIVAEAYGPKHYKFSGALTLLADVRRRQKRLDEAEALERESLAIRRAAFATPNGYVADSLNSLGNILLDKGDTAGAVEAFRDSIAIQRAVGGDRRRSFANTLNNLARALFTLKELDEAEQLIRAALAVDQALFDGDDARVIDDRKGLSYILEAAGRLVEATDELREVIAAQTRTLPPGNPAVPANRLRLANLLMRRAADTLAATPAPSAPPTDVEALLREALAIREVELPPDHWQTASARSLLGLALLRADRVDEAEPHLRAAAETLLRAAAAPPARTREAVERMITLCEQRGDTAGAAEWRSRLPPAP
ncbi:MAG: tetratricopeptide repeat protein [Phycisphaerae bacterium]